MGREKGETIFAYLHSPVHFHRTDSSTGYDAVLRNLELIGEAATHIPEDVRNNHPEIPWRMIVATRNRLIHAYLGIDNDTVWSIICDDIPDLLSALQNITEDAAT